MALPGTPIRRRFGLGSFFRRAAAWKTIIICVIVPTLSLSNGNNSNASTNNQTKTERPGNTERINSISNAESENRPPSKLSDKPVNLDAQQISERETSPKYAPRKLPRDATVVLDRDISGVTDPGISNLRDPVGALSVLENSHKATD
jgi:hypothetical protein